MSYSGFLKAYKIPEAKSYFPYEWFDHPSKLDFPGLPPYQTFYSQLKQRNVLQMRDKTDQDDEDNNNDQDDKELGIQRYQELQNIWRDHGMTPFRDFLEYYNNLDVGPFVQAVEKMQQFYFNHHINLFKVAVSVPGIAHRWLFQTAHEPKTSFSLIQPQDDDLYYIIKQNIVGGPSIIFTRDAKVGRTFIRNNPTCPCASIVGYDTNALYLDCIDKAMPCGGYVHRYAPDFKPDSPLSCEDMFHWMNYLMETESVHILHKRNHISEVRVDPYLVDGYDPNMRTVYEFHGCYFHGCSHCKKDQDDLGKEPKMHTDTKEKYLRNKGYNLKIIWEHEFKSMQRSDPKLKEFVRHVNLPSFANIVGSPKYPPSAMLCWTIPSLGFWRLISMSHSICMTISRKCHPSFVTPKSSSRTWEPSCSSMSMTTTCRTNPDAFSSAVRKLKNSCCLPLI